MITIEEPLSIVRSIRGRFLLLSLAFSVLPILVLLYLYLAFSSGGAELALSKLQFQILLILSSLVAGLSLVAMAQPLFKMADLIRVLRNGVLNGIEQSGVARMTGEPGEVGAIARCMVVLASQLQGVEKELEQARKRLRNPRASLRSEVAFNINFESQLGLILETTLEALNAEAGAIISLEEEKRYGLLAEAVPEGTSEETLEAAVDSQLKPLFGEGRLVVLPAVGESGPTELFAPPLLYAPVRAMDRVVAAVCVSGKKQDRNFSDREVMNLSKLSAYLCIPFQHFKVGKDVQRTYFEALRVLASVVEFRDPCTEGHSQRVAQYCRRIGESLGLSAEKLNLLKDAALVHDVGNLSVPSSVLAKSGPLDGAERVLVNKHPLVGESMLSLLSDYRFLLDPVKHHHEFLDGSGYPDGLKGAKITQVTRILTVANLYDALTSERAYRSAFSPVEAVGILKQMVLEGKLDESSVEALESVIQDDSNADFRKVS